MITEKIDLFNMFEPTCRKYHVPIGNAKGWMDINMKYTIALKFKEAESHGLIPVLLHYGDFDPSGILIGEKIKENFEEMKEATGWDPKNLIVNSFGLSFDFIQKFKLSWIDGLKTSGNKDLDDPSHKFHNSDFVKDYISKYGARKCEANAVLPVKEDARDLCEETIKKYLGDDPFEELNNRKNELDEEIDVILHEIKYYEVTDFICEKIYPIIDEWRETLIEKFEEYEKKK